MGKVVTKLDQIREIKNEENSLDTQPTPNTIRKDILNQLLNGLDVPPLGIVPNAPNNIKDLLKINEQNIPMYSRNSTSLSPNSSDENLRGSMDLISDKSMKIGNIPQP